MEQEYRLISRDWEMPCSYCGVLIKKGEPNIHKDKKFLEETQFEFAKVYHNHCYEQYLEEGESSD